MAKNNYEEDIADDKEGNNSLEAMQSPFWYRSTFFKV